MPKMGRLVSFTVLVFLLGLTKPAPSPASVIYYGSYWTPSGSISSYPACTMLTGTLTNPLTGDTLVPSDFVVGVFITAPHRTPVSVNIGGSTFVYRVWGTPGVAWEDASVDGADGAPVRVLPAFGDSSFSGDPGPVFIDPPAFPLTDIPTGSGLPNPAPSVVFAQGTSLDDPHSPQSVPEPSTLLLLMSGLGALAGVARRRRRTRPSSITGVE